MSNIFVGFAVTDSMRSDFEQCPKKNKIYIEDSSYLEFVTISGTEYIGKRVQSGIAQDRLEDVARSVVSLLARVNEDSSLSADQALLLAAEEEEKPPPKSPSESSEGDDFDYLGLVD